VEKKSALMLVTPASNEEPAKLNRDVALQAVRPNSLFSNVVFRYFMSQNNPLVLFGFYQNLTIMHQKQSSQYVIGFSYKKSAGHRYRQICFLFGKILWKNAHDLFRAVQRQQRKSDVMTSFDLAACSAVYYQVSHCRFLIIAMLTIRPHKKKVSLSSFSSYESEEGGRFLFLFFQFFLFSLHKVLLYNVGI
jgi:hypothetical protein